MKQAYAGPMPPQAIVVAETLAKPLAHYGIYENP